jgi:hypothetical protein
MYIYIYIYIYIQRRYIIYTSVDFSSQIVAWVIVPCPINKGVSHQFGGWLGRDLKIRLLLLLLLCVCVCVCVYLSLYLWFPKHLHEMYVNLNTHVFYFH